jgi:putative ABC transport system permease protein
MPSASLSSNRAMFWRILRRFISGNPGRLAVMLLALGAGATITAALLNLKVDAQRRLTTEFRSFGANVVVAPRTAAMPASASEATLDQSILGQIPAVWGQHGVAMGPRLYLVADARKASSNHAAPVVIAGRTGDFLSGASNEFPCEVGVHVAAQMQIETGNVILQNTKRQETCHPSLTLPTGGSEDDQIAVTLYLAQNLAGLPGRLSLVELTVPGTPQQISNYIANLQQQLPDADVRPIRQFTEGEAKIYNRISGVLTATVALVLVLTALCVMAAMTNVAMERRNDVGLMKAIGGATRRVLRLFLVEAALLGLTSGILGAALGIVLSMWLGKSVFGLAARPRLIVYPVAVALTIIVAIAGAYPLRRLANIRPASVFRGEG